MVSVVCYDISMWFFKKSSAWYISQSSIEKQNEQETDIDVEIEIDGYR